MITGEEFKQICILAFRDAQEDYLEAYIKKLQRWYSTTFSTPLPQVEEMSDHYLVRVFFDQLYYDLFHNNDGSPEDTEKRISEIRAGLLKTDEDEQSVEQQDDEWVKQMEVEVRASEKRRKDKQNQEVQREKPNLIAEKDAEMSLSGGDSSADYNPKDGE